MYNKIQRLKPEKERQYYTPPSLPPPTRFSKSMDAVGSCENECTIVQIDKNMNIKGDFISFMREYCTK